MNLFLVFVFIFFIGSTIGWILELFFRRIYHGKWVNPGFLVGPYLPIYGFGLTIMTIVYYFFDFYYHLSPIISIILIGLLITMLELMGGLLFLKSGIRLWDYRDRWLNFKGVICPLFTLIWTACGAIYYLFIASHIMNALTWFSNNISFSYVLGLFSGFIFIDYLYSTNLYIKIKKYAKTNDIDIMYEKLKEHIKDVQKHAKEKYSFAFPFNQTKSLKEYLSEYKENILTRKGE